MLLCFLSQQIPLPAMCRIGRLLLPGIIVLLNSNVSGKTLITEPSIQPVYIKAGNQLTFRCEQNNNYKIRWSHLPRSSPWGSGPSEYLALSSDAGFNQTTFEQNGRQVNILVKVNVEVNDSGSYRCEVLSGLDTSYAVDLYVINIQGVEGIMAKVGGGATLQCRISSEEPITAKFLWFRNNTMLAQLPRKYTIDSSSGLDLISSLHISRLGEADIGEYLCHVTLGNGMNFTHIVHLSSFPHVRPFEKSRTLVEGEDLALECRAWGWPFPTVAWFRNNISLSTGNEDSRVNFRNASLLVNAGLLVNNVTYSDRANYTCVATARVNGTAVTGSASIFIRVKGRLAPLYPLLGIVAEMLVLFIIILVYERRRRRQRAKELSESADDLIASYDRLLEDQISLKN